MRATFPFLTLLIVACSGSPERPDPGPQGEFVTGDYRQQIDKYSAGESDFDGFHNSFQFRATYVNSEIQNALNQKKADYFQWSRDKFMAEQEKTGKEMGTKTKIFVSFFTPSRENDNLAKGNAIWKVFLDVGGQRYEGRVKKSYKLIAEIKTLFPYHNRWSTPYWVSFPVPTSEVERLQSKLTITGPLGVREVDFPGLR